MNTPIDISSVTIKTQRLLLRPWLETDAEDFYEYARVDDVGQRAGWLPHKDITESKRILSHFIEGKHVFALEYQGRVIGSLGIECYNEGHYPELSSFQGREIGYVLSRDYWGQGLMPEAVRAVINYLFDTVQLDFIIVGHFDWNSRSRRVIEKCGFRYSKTLPYTTQFGKEERSVEYILWKTERR